MTKGITDFTTGSISKALKSAILISLAVGIVMFTAVQPFPTQLM